MNIPSNGNIALGQQHESTTAGAQSRRLACDRCRGHKLRCERSLTSDGNLPLACQRCSRARVECVTSPPLRIGRPSISKRFPELSSSSSEHNLASSIQHGGRETADLSLSQSMVSGNGQAATPTGSPRSFVLTPAISTNDLDVDYQDVDASATACSSQNLFGAPEWLSGFDNQFNENPYEGTMDFSFDMSLPAFSESPSLHAGGAVSHEVQQLSPIALRDTQLQKLSDLNISLARQLNRVNDGQLENSTTFPPCKSIPTQNDRSPSHPIGSLLDSYEKFVVILGYSLSVSPEMSPGIFKSGYEESDGSRINNDTVLSMGSVSPTLNQLQTRITPQGGKPTDSDYFQPDLPTFLQLLACYVSLVRISKIVFAHIHNTLVSCPSPRAKALRTLPGLQMSGFRIGGDRHLQIKMIMQAIKHNLERVEKALAIIDARCNGTNDGDCGILEAVVRKEAMDSRDGQVGRVPPLSEIMKNIEHFMAKTSVW